MIIINRYLLFNILLLHYYCWYFWPIIRILFYY